MMSQCQRGLLSMGIRDVKVVSRSQTYSSFTLGREEKDLVNIV